MCTTLIGIFDREDQTISNAMRLARRLLKSIGHNRRALHEFRADICNFQVMMIFPKKQTAFESLKFVGG